SRVYRVKEKEISRLVSFSLSPPLLAPPPRRVAAEQGRAGWRSPSGEQSSGGEGILVQGHLLFSFPCRH
uniref:Uncharacterized protein n=1 Tax=Oryza meridionalis TaxID=40149 RepID=A0A0E0EXL8_9ORYZ